MPFPRWRRFYQMYTSLLAMRVHCVADQDDLLPALVLPRLMSRIQRAAARDDQPTFPATTLALDALLLTLLQSSTNPIPCIRSRLSRRIVDNCGHRR